MSDGIHHLDLPQGCKSNAANIAVRSRFLGLFNRHDLSGLDVKCLVHLAQVM